MSELPPFTPNKMIPVTITSKNITDSTTIILLFLPNPFLLFLYTIPNALLYGILLPQKIKNWSKHEILPNYAIVRDHCHVWQYAITSLLFLLVHARSILQSRNESTR